MHAISFTHFCEQVLAVELSPGQRVLALVAIDGVDPCQLRGAERKLARELFGDVDRFPPEARDVLVILKGRACGGTFIFESLYSLWRALTADLSTLAPGEPVIAAMVAPRQDQARHALLLALGTARACPSVAPLIKHVTADSFTVARPDGRRVRVEVSPATAGGLSLRGRWMTSLTMGEAAFFRTDDFHVNADEIFAACAPRVLEGGLVVMPSTPWIESGLLHSEFTKNFGTPKTAMAARAPTLLLLNTKLNRSVVNRELERAPDNARREFFAEFGSTTANLLDPRRIDEAVMPGVEELAPEAGEYVEDAGDLALHGDFCVHMGAIKQFIARPSAPPLETMVVKFAHHWEPSRVGRLLKKKIDVDEIEHEFAQTHKRYRAGTLTLDGWGYDFFANRMSKRGVQTELASMSPASQAARAATMVSLFESGAIRIPDNSVLIKQLKGLLVTRLPGGAMRFASAQRRGEHDDFPKTLMLLCEKFARKGASVGRGQRVAWMRPSQTGDIYSETPISGHFNPHGGGLIGFEKKWFRKNPDGSRTRVDAPEGTPQFEAARAARFAQGIFTGADVQELGEDAVHERLGLNRKVSG